MLLDLQTKFSEAQPITATAVSTNTTAYLTFTPQRNVIYPVGFAVQ